MNHPRSFTTAFAAKFSLFMCLFAFSAQAQQFPIRQSGAPNADAPRTEPGGLELIVQVTDIKHEEGQVLIAVFNQEIGFPKEINKAFVSAKASPTQPVAKFKDLPPGSYAVVVIHDRNRNGEIDKNFVGMPTEPVGLSNYSSIGFSNPPKFQKASFTMRQSGSLKVKLLSL